MKTLIVICFAFPVFVFSQEDALTDSLTIPSDSLTATVIPVVKDTVNVTDSLGMKQGYWMYFGKDFPNSGVASSEVLEDGYFANDQRTGLWYRYGTGGQVKAVMNYKLDKKTKQAARDQFYYYVHYPNGAIKRKPVIGSCRNMSDYYQYDENGELLEVELFDSLCNTTCKLQRIQKGEMDSISVFLISPQFHEPDGPLADTGEVALTFDQTGEYCVDYNHRTFRVGSFQNGSFIRGKEFLVDEMMRTQRVRYYEDGKLVKVLVK